MYTSPAFFFFFFCFSCSEFYYSDLVDGSIGDHTMGKIFSPMVLLSCETHISVIARCFQLAEMHCKAFSTEDTDHYNGYFSLYTTRIQRAKQELAILMLFERLVAQVRLCQCYRRCYRDPSLPKLSLVGSP